MQIRNNYESMTNHEKFLITDFEELRKLVYAYEENDKQIPGFPGSDLVKLNHALDKLRDTSFSSFPDSTSGLIDNFLVSFSFLKKPITSGSLVQIKMQEMRKTSEFESLPKSINELSENITILQDHLKDELTQVSCKRLLSNLKLFEVDLNSFNVEESKINNAKVGQDQKKTMNGNSVSLTSSNFFANNNVMLHDNAVVSKSKKEEEEHKQITPPKSPRSQ